LLMMHDPKKIKIGVARVPLSMANGSTTIANYYFLIVGFSRIMEHQPPPTDHEQTTNIKGLISNFVWSLFDSLWQVFYLIKYL